VALHLERMAGNHWWMSIGKRGRLGTLHVNFTARRAMITATVHDAGSPK
jgi:hypothetical protein